VDCPQKPINCKDNISHHLQSCHKPKLVGNIKEYELILARSGMFYVQTIKQEEKLGEITPLDVQLKTTWDEATEAEKERGIDKAIEECRVVCNVIARNAGEELLQ
jgi:hypothetical protein